MEHNYYETFIRVAEDCPVDSGEVPTARGGKRTAAQAHYEMTRDAPYRYTQEQVLFAAELTKKGLDPKDHPEGGETWQAFYSKGQPCLRASPLAKRYGWGFHFDADGRVAALDRAEPAYAERAADASLRQLAAMRTRRAR